MDTDFQDKQAEWLSSIILPIEMDGVVGSGSDPRYSERFSRIKAEIENKVNTDFECIFLLSREALEKDGKDLRVAGYLLFSATRLYGINGFNFGLQVLTQLISGFQGSLYPVKSAGREAALMWIAQDRILHFLDQDASQPDEQSLQLLQKNYVDFCVAASTLLKEGFSWKKMSDWLDKRLKAVATPVVTQVSKSPSTGISHANMTGEIQSDTHLIQIFRQILNYYKKNNDYASHVALTRSVRWANIKLPPAEEQLTRIPAPPVSDMARIENLIGQAQWIDALFACEDAFMSPGGLFLFDYQRLAFQCAQMAGLSNVANVIESQVAGLLKRLPKIVQLKFSDESAFASSRFLAWVEQLAGSTANEHRDAADHLGQAREIVNSSGLTAALQWLDEQPSAGGLEHLQRHLVQAQLCVENGQSGLALPLLNRLNEEIGRYQLARLVPAFALQVWRQLQFALEETLRRTRGAEEKIELKKQIQQTNHLICSTDITRASQWL